MRANIVRPGIASRPPIVRSRFSLKNDLPAVVIMACCLVAAVAVALSAFTDIQAGAGIAAAFVGLVCTLAVTGLARQ